MKLDPSAEITVSKLRNYLLTFQGKGDKSEFLAQVGYTRTNWERLQLDIREQLLPLDAEWSRRTAYGDYYVTKGPLQGPNGATWRVTSVWIVEYGTGRTRLITLYADRG